MIEQESKMHARFGEFPGEEPGDTYCANCNRWIGLWKEGVGCPDCGWFEENEDNPTEEEQ